MAAMRPTCRSTIARLGLANSDVNESFLPGFVTVVFVNFLRAYGWPPCPGRRQREGHLLVVRIPTPLNPIPSPLAQGERRNVSYRTVAASLFPSLGTNPP